MKLKQKNKNNKINVETIIKRPNGITLIALVITIIVLVILAGVAISLTIGENGLLNKAKYAKEEYKLAQAREELELEILQVQTKIMEEQKRNATLEDLLNLIDTDKYDIVLYYTPLASNEETQVKATYSKVKEISSGIMFVVDSKLVINDVKLMDENESLKISNFEVSIENANGSYLTINANSAATNDGSAIELYKYYINGEKVREQEESTYTVTDLELNTEYSIKVIVVDEDGKEKTSNIKKYTTANVQYLYKNGDTCDTITGGWTVEGIAMSDTSALQPNLLKKEYLNVSLTSPSGYSSGVLKTENNLDYSNYKKMYIKYSASMGHYSGGACFGLSKNTMDYVPGTSLKTLCYWNAINNVTEEIDLNGMQPEDTLKIYMQVHQSEGQVSMTIYQIWLEK